MTVTVQFLPALDRAPEIIERVCVIKEMGTNFIFETFRGALPGSTAFIQMQQVYGPDFQFESEEGRTTYDREVSMATVASLAVLP
jgi:hypothetical protein